MIEEEVLPAGVRDVDVDADERKSALKTKDIGVEIETYK